MDFFQLWDQILDYIDQYDHPYYDMFSNEVFPISMTENTLTISPKNKRRKPWIENVYKGKLEKIIFDITGKQLSIEISDIMNQPAEPAPIPPVPEAGASKKQAASEAPFPMARETADAPYENTPAPLPEPDIDDPFPKEAMPPDFSKLKPMTADEVPLPDIRELGETSLFDAPVRSEPKNCTSSIRRKSRFLYLARNFGMV